MRCGDEWAGKIKTALQTTAVILLCLPLWTLPLASLWLWIAYAILALTVGVTLVTGYEIARDALRLRQTSPRAMRKRAARAREQDHD